MKPPILSAGYTHIQLGEHTMFKFLKGLQKRLSTKPHTKYHSDLDIFITSKNPKTPADIEYWVRQYEFRGGAYGKHF
jgi:hypothetical protein